MLDQPDDEHEGGTPAEADAPQAADDAPDAPIAPEGEASDTPGAPAGPTRLGKYQVTRCVAQGTMTEVLHARLEGIAGFERHFAIRRLLPSVASHDLAVRIVEAEVRAAASLAHGNIVQTLDLGHDDDRLYVVTEWVDGWSLEDVLERVGEEGTPVPVPQVCWIGLQIAKALAWAHTRPVPDEPTESFVHDGIEPGHILLSRGGEVKVGDFGLARAAARIREVAPEVMAPADTPVAPERRDGTFGPAADVWATAWTLDRLLGGVTGDDPARTGVPDELVDVLTRALDDDPAARPTTEALGDVLLDVLREGDVFTQERLAAWLRALYGEAAPVADDPMPRDPTEDGVPLDDGLELEADPDTPAPAERTAPRIADEDDDGRTAVAAAGQRAVPSRPREEDDLALDDAVSPADEPPPVPDEPDPAPPAPAPTPVPVPSFAPPVDPGPGWPVAIAMLVVGALLGGAAGYALVPPPAPVPPPGASLRVQVAEDAPATVSVDGELLRGTRPLPAGSHTVEVVFAGGATWAGEVAVEEGSRHLLVVDPTALRPADSDAGLPPEGG